MKERVKKDLANFDLRALLGATQGHSTRESIVASFFEM